MHWVLKKFWKHICDIPLPETCICSLKRKPNSNRLIWRSPWTKTDKQDKTRMNMSKWQELHNTLLHPIHTSLPSSSPLFPPPLPLFSTYFYPFSLPLQLPLSLYPLPSLRSSPLLPTTKGSCSVWARETTIPWQWHWSFGQAAYAGGGMYLHV